MCSAALTRPAARPPAFSLPASESSDPKLVELGGERAGSPALRTVPAVAAELSDSEVNTS